MKQLKLTSDSHLVQHVLCKMVILPNTCIKGDSIELAGDCFSRVEPKRRSTENSSQSWRSCTPKIREILRNFPHSINQINENDFQSIKKKKSGLVRILFLAGPMT